MSKLDHLARLGITAVWLSPVTVVAEPRLGLRRLGLPRPVHPALGTLDDLEHSPRQAGQRGIRILMDLVPNHTSDQHAWFVDARTGRTSAKRDYYVWAYS